MTRVRLSNRPLLDTRTDAALFVAREPELTRLRRCLDLGVNTLLEAAPGVGKTSVLRQLTWRERQAGRPAPHYVSATPAGSVSELILLVAAGLGVHQLGSREENPLDLVVRLAGAVKEIDRPVILLDEPDPDLAYTLFGRLRDEVWELPLVWVVAMDTADAVRLLRPPADAFFEVRLELPRLGAAELRELLVRRLPGADGAVTADVLDELAATGDPRRALDDARQLLTADVSWDELKHARSQRDRVVGKLGRPARMMVDALTRLGGSASASDPELLDVLGWTRPRAVQVLSELEDAGVLGSATVRAGVGRPRKVYRLTEAGAA